MSEAEPYPAPDNPMRVARHLEPRWRLDGAAKSPLLCRRWRGAWMEWRRTHWVEVDAAQVRAWNYRQLENAQYEVVGEKKITLKPWAPNRRKIADLMEAQSGIVLMRPEIDAPSWPAMARDPAHCAADQIVACENGLLVVPTRELLPLTPEFFNLVSVPFEYDPEAAEPKRWLRFLEEVWPDDQDSINALQEWFGYVISGRSDLHKIMLMVGPTRSGKGTIARVLTALVGKANMAGPTLASLCTNFGLSSLVGKPLAIVSDARLSGNTSQAVVERLLTISGEDTIDVDRKYRELWTGKLPTRFLILSNELPAFGDSSGVIANRFIVLGMHVSWLGKENPALTNELLEELPAILNWSLDGLARLSKQGRFTEPEASKTAVTAMQDMASPVGAFVRERCETGPSRQVRVDDLFAAWCDWCEGSHRAPGNKQTFGRNLRSVVPQMLVSQRRNIDGRDRLYDGISLRTEQS